MAGRVVDERMRAYYERRAPEYDDWWLGAGLFADLYGHLLLDERKGIEAEAWQERVLEDGSRHHVYKRFFTGEELAEEPGGGDVPHEGGWFGVVRSGDRTCR
jgi:hypothetical protein